MLSCATLRLWLMNRLNQLQASSSGRYSAAARVSERGAGSASERFTVAVGDADASAAATVRSACRLMVRAGVEIARPPWNLMPISRQAVIQTRYRTLV